jgi:hypothetical protein
MIEVIKQLVEALEWCHGGEPVGTAEAIEAGKQAIAELENQKPFAYVNVEMRRLEFATDYVKWDTPTTIKLDKIPLYTYPPQRTEQEPVAWLGFNPRSGAPEFACDKPAPSVMRDYNMKPLVYTNSTPPAAQPAQEPVACECNQGQVCHTATPHHHSAQRKRTMNDESCYEMIDRFLQNNLYSDDYEEYLEALDQLSRPTPRTWVGLTDGEIEDLYFDKFSMGELKAFAKAIEAKLKEKNT